MIDIYALARPALFKIEPETAHNMLIAAMKRGMVPGCGAYQDPILEQEIWGLKFPGPVGLAAGFDKNAEVVGPALRLGFGFVEAGTVTPKPQNGNPKPRVFREPEHEAVINRMGFPNRGVNAFKDNLVRFLDLRPRPAGIVGLNIGMNKEQSAPVKDYVGLIRMLGPMADYLTVNISSPNTPGLRDLQSRNALLELVSALKEELAKSCGEHSPPLLVKFAPDLDEAKQEELAKAALEAKIDGLVLTNTTLERPEKLPTAFRHEAGGLSGQPLGAMSTEVIHNFYKLTKGKLPIIGVGGVSSGRDAYDKIRAGASLVQLYSAMVFHGPGIAGAVSKELAGLLKSDGYETIAQAVGAAHSKTKNKKQAGA